MRWGIVFLLAFLTGCATPFRSQQPPSELKFVRPAQMADVPLMVQLSARKRTQYASYEPVFWRVAEHADEDQQKFFADMIVDRSWICLVHPAGNGIDGFIMAHITNAPPVYDPGGKVCMIDDFAVADPQLWPTVGMAMRIEAERRALDAGAVVSVTVCGRHDEAKRDILRQSGAQVASEWYVQTLKPAGQSPRK